MSTNETIKALSHAYLFVADLRVTPRTLPLLVSTTRSSMKAQPTSAHIINSNSSTSRKDDRIVRIDEDLKDSQVGGLFFFLLLLCHLSGGLFCLKKHCCRRLKKEGTEEEEYGSRWLSNVPSSISSSLLSLHRNVIIVLRECRTQQWRWWLSSLAVALSSTVAVVRMMFVDVGMSLAFFCSPRPV